VLVLTYRDESENEVVVPLESGKVVTVGRNPGSTIRVRNPSVSRNHARILESEGSWFVEDLGSSNHSFVNDEKVQKAPIALGDVLRFGKCPVKVEESRAGAEVALEADESARTERAESSHQASKVESKGHLAEEKERRRLAREAKRAKHASTAKEEEVAPKAEKRKRPTRHTEAESAVEPECSEPEAAPKRKKPTRSPSPLDASEEVQPNEAAPEDTQLGDERDEPSLEVEESEAAEEVEERRRPASKPSRDNEIRQRRRGSGERKAAAEARKEAVVSKRQDPGFNKDLREAQSRAGEMELALHKAESRVSELETRLKEVETRDARHEEELDGWHERYNRVREQLSHQGELLERAKISLSERDEELAEAESRVASLGSELGALEGSRTETNEMMSELKARAVQKDRRIDELQRELDLMEFDLREAREEIEGLIDERNVETGDQRRIARETELLRELNAEKENVVAELKLELEERSRELYDAKLGSGIKDLEEARRDVLEQFFEKNREVDALEETLKGRDRDLAEARREVEELEEQLVARRDLSNHPDFQRKQRELERAQSDFQDAEEAIERLQQRLEEFGPEAKSKLDAEVNFLERKNKALQERVNALQERFQDGAAPAEAPHSDDEDEQALEGLRESASSHLDGTLDDYADWKSNLMLLKTYLDEVREAVDSEGDVVAAFESVEELLTVVSSEANGFRRQLVSLKKLFDTNE